MRETLRRFGQSVIETVYPSRCAGCGRRGTWACSDCDAALRRLARPWCERCGSPPTLIGCRCGDLVHELSVVRSVALHEGWLRAAIRSFKYHGESAQAGHLGAMLVPLLTELSPFDALVAVPLHPSRERKRGYNQAYELASSAAALSGGQVETPMTRVRATPQQVGLSADQRRANVQAAFAIQLGAEIAGKRFVLIDDVLTTGSTLGACARALVEAGALTVSAITLTRES